MQEKGRAQQRVDEFEEEDDNGYDQVLTNNHPRRGQNLEDNKLSNIKLNIIHFQGRNDLEAYLEWVRKMDLFFKCHNYSESKKVKLAMIEFTDYAAIWWEQLLLSRRRNVEDHVSTWGEMKVLMKK